MANKYYNQFYYTGHKMPIQLDCQWTVDSTNAAGVSSLTGAGIKNVYMHSGSPSAANPNPASGYAIVQFQDNFHGYYFGGAQLQSPLSGAEISISGSSVLTIGEVYVITTVGTSTAANWQAVGLPVGIVPAVGVAFVASATGSGTGTGKVKINAAAGSGIAMVDVVGNPAVSIIANSTNVPGVNGSYMILRFLAPSATSQALTFTGSALGTHSHDLKVIGGQAASTTNDIAAYAGPILGKEEAADATIAGADSATNGGVIAASAGTPAGTINTPTITSSLVAAAPAAGSIVRANFVFSNSRILNNGS